MCGKTMVEGWLASYVSVWFHCSLNRGLKIVREGRYYYVIHQGEILRCLGSRRDVDEERSLLGSNGLEREFTEKTGSSLGILDQILFFIGDLEVASVGAKRRRVAH